MSPESTKILASFANALLDCGNHEEASYCADLALSKVSTYSDRKDLNVHSIGR